MLFQCWVSVEDGGPTLKQNWVNALCLLGICNGCIIISNRDTSMSKTISQTSVIYFLEIDSRTSNKNQILSEKNDVMV